MILSKKQIIDITGLTQAGAQKRWLSRNGIPYLTAQSGRPVVHESALVARLMPSKAQTAPRLDLA
jgi:hypothetical protein